MPFDGNYSYKADLMWAEFGRYVSDTYAQNPVYSVRTEQWLHDLNERRLKTKKLLLAFVELENELTGRKLRAYRINRQVYLSRDPAVLTLPYPRSFDDPIGAIYPDRLVGIYLHDFGYDQRFFSQCQHSLELLNPEITDYYSPAKCHRRLKPYIRSVRCALKRDLNTPSLPGGKANNLKTWELRLQRGEVGGWHRDDDHEGSEAWTRVLVHPLMGTGTEYMLEGNMTSSHGERESKLICPLGAVSSHIAVRAYSIDENAWGVRHRAVPHRLGRAVLIKWDDPNSADWSLLGNDRSPWRNVKVVCAL